MSSRSQRKIRCHLPGCRGREGPGCDGPVEGPWLAPELALGRGGTGVGFGGPEDDPCLVPGRGADVVGPCLAPELVLGRGGCGVGTCLFPELVPSWWGPGGGACLVPELVLGCAGTGVGRGSPVLGRVGPGHVSGALPWRRADLRCGCILDLIWLVGCLVWLVG